MLILINGVIGAGKTAVGQSIVYEENKNGTANSVYLSGNGPLVEVLQYQINQVGTNKHMAENTIQGIKEFKSSYFFNDTKVPEQSILIFEEAQRAWDVEKLVENFMNLKSYLELARKSSMNANTLFLLIYMEMVRLFIKGKKKVYR